MLILTCVAKHHFGSSMVVELVTVPPGGMYTLQLEDKAHIENAEAIGPNVPAMRGHAVDSNQYRLQHIVSAHAQSRNISKKRKHYLGLV